MIRDCFIGTLAFVAGIGAKVAADKIRKKEHPADTVLDATKDINASTVDTLKALSKSVQDTSVEVVAVGDTVWRRVREKTADAAEKVAEAVRPNPVLCDGRVLTEEEKEAKKQELQDRLSKLSKQVEMLSK